jgi:hypothetical protein
MELNTEKLQLSEHFLDVAVANTRKKRLVNVYIQAV